MTNNSDTLKIKSLNIKSIPGISHGIPAYEEMGEDLVLITGPNASGKSSTVRAIKHLLWQTSDSNFYDVSAKLQVQDKLWEVIFRNGELRIYKDGQITEEKIPKYEFPNRYSLSINDLFLSDESELAEQLQKELYGGVNLDDIYESENYRSSVYTIGKDEYKKYSDAKDQYNKVKKEQKSLKKDQEKLDSLNKKCERLNEETQKLDLINKALEFKKNQTEFKKSQAKLNAYDNIMEKLLTFPVDKLPEWKNNRRRASEEARQLQNEINQLEEQIDNLKISHLDIEDLKLNKLEILKDSIISIESQIEGLKDNKIIAENKLKELSQRLGYNRDENLEEWEHYDQLINIELGDIAEINKLVQEYNYNLATMLQLKAKADAISEIIDKHDENEVEKADFQAGIRSLTNWLKEKKAKNKLNTGYYFIYVILICAAIWVALLYELPALWLIGGTIIISITFYYISSINKGQNIRKQDYRDAGFKNLEEWTIDAVSSRVDTLINQQQEHYRTNQHQEEYDKISKEYKTQKKNVDGLINDINQHRNNIASTLQVDRSNLSVNLVGNYVNTINEWKGAHENYISICNKMDAVVEDKKGKIENFNDIVKETEFENCNTIEEVKVTYSEISKQRNNSREYHSEKSSKQTRLETFNEDFKEYSEKINQAFESLGKTEEDEAEVLNRLKDIDEYKDIKKTVSELRTKVNLRRKDYEEILEEMEIDEDLMSYTVEQLEREKQASANASEELAEVRDEITTINTKIEEAKRKSDLENALKEKDEAEEELMNLYKENLSKNIGDIILKKLQTQDQQENQPEILKRANELLSRITNGKYEVRMNTDSQNPEFMGYDTQKQRKIKLSELSSGTRIHLLLSLRIASIEQQEKRNRNWKMPIFADEILANSDEERSEAIIRALIEISKSGRQVFYLTAQQDEIRKWTEHLRKQDEITYTAYELNNEKNKEAVELNTIDQLPEGISIDKNIPQPTSLHKDDYKSVLEGNEMEVGDYNLFLDKPTELHLWYFLNDMNDLQKLLINAVKTWGQLQSLARNDEEYQNLIEKHNIKEKATVLEKYQSLNRIGKAVPINRAILLENNVTEAKIEEVTTLMEEVERNPQKLIEKITDVNGIGPTRKEEIKTSLIENGFIPTEEKKEPDEIERIILNLIKDMSITQKEVQIFLDQFKKDE